MSEYFIHGVGVELLQKQAESIGLPLEIIEIPYPCSNADYEKIMGQFVKKAKSNYIDRFVFGDVMLADVRDYRERKLKRSGIQPVFPLWGMSTDTLSREMIRSGLRAVITCVDPKQIPKEFIGRELNERFLDSLPETADPCGENGEFHSFVFDGPMFQERLEIAVGDIVSRDGFVFADILSKGT